MMGLRDRGSGGCRRGVGCVSGSCGFCVSGAACFAGSGWFMMLLLDGRREQRRSLVVEWVAPVVPKPVGQIAKAADVCLVVDEVGYEADKRPQAFRVVFGRPDPRPEQVLGDE